LFMATWVRKFASLAVIGSILTAAAAATFARAATPSNVEIEQAYSLLMTTYYRPISPRTIARGARASLEKRFAAAHVSLPPVPAAVDDHSATQYIEHLVEVASSKHIATVADSLDAVLHGMAQAPGDPYTAFLSSKELRQFMTPLDPARLSGIGVLLDPNTPPAESMRAYFVEPDAPADKAGIRPGDRIVSVDGTETKGLKVEQVTKMLRGPAGTQVHAMIASGSEAPREVIMTRATVRVPTVYFSKMGSVGYIYVTSFSNTSADEVSAALKRLETEKVTGYVLDLRYDSGGYVQAALDIANDFVADGPLVSIQGRTGSVQTIDADGNAVTAKPLAVLVNRWSASASEIAAAALQENHAAILIGTRTYGKGVMQTMRFIDEGAAIKITTARYLTPENHDINKRGILPDKVVDEPASDRFGDAQHDTQLQAALQYLQDKTSSAGSGVS
jgi:carboxyl-terminal processing protease